MNKLKKFSNQELLAEIDQRMPYFTSTDLMELIKLQGRHQQQMEKFYQTISPEFSRWYQKRTQEMQELRKSENWKINKY